MRSDAEQFVQRLSRYIAHYDYTVTESGGAYELALKNHITVPWHPPKKRFLRGHVPSSFHYEPVATAVLDFLIDTYPIREFFDLGAAGGYFSILASGRTDREIRSHAFEMQPFQFDVIRAQRENLSLNNIVPHLSGMSDTYVGERQIWYSVTKMYLEKPERHLYRDGFFRRLKFRLKGRTERDQLKSAIVTLDSLDHFCSSNSIVADIVKIDVDGFEAKVVPGGHDIFQRHRPFVMLEIHKQRMLDRFGVTRRDVVVPLFQAGYHCVFFDDHHALSKARPRLVSENDACWDRNRTDFSLFF